MVHFYSNLIYKCINLFWAYKVFESFFGSIAVSLQNSLGYLLFLWFHLFTFLFFFFLDFGICSSCGEGKQVLREAVDINELYVWLFFWLKEMSLWGLIVILTSTFKVWLLASLFSRLIGNMFSWLRPSLLPIFLSQDWRSCSCSLSYSTIEPFLIILWYSKDSDSWRL